jgi:eukaryotic-like serine/threonine-protein kinase
MTLCSSDRLLSPLLEEQLDQDEYDSIVAHVEACPRCQERLQQLTDDSSLFVERERYDRCLSDSWPTEGAAICSARPLGQSIPGDPAQTLGQPIDGECVDADSAEVAGFDIVAELGHGGMGVVYKARQRRLNRLVALKRIRAGSLARSEDIARFRIEAEAVARLRHPNIIQIFDVGESGGLPFVALELLEGGSLDARLAGTPQPGRAAAALVSILARAVHAAHEAGIVHRDLKPSNVLFALDGTPKITDFGLAKRLEAAGNTETGQIMGSPSYIPPEQARGQTRDVGPPADIYALGAILYEMLTGRPPFKGTTPLDTVMQVLHEEPVPLSRLQSKVPQDLEIICLKCLAKEPHKRYVDAQALSDDLDRYLADQPIRARRTPFWERGLKLARRRPTAFSFLALGVAVALSTPVAAIRYQADQQARHQHEDERIAALRQTAESVMIRVRDDLMSGRDTTEESLYRLLPTIEPEPRLADFRSEAAGLLEEYRRRRFDEQSRAAARDRYREFFRRRDETLLHDTRLTSFDASGDVKTVRTLALSALELFAEEHAGSDGWDLAPLPSSWTSQEKDEVVEGCYEMLMVLAEAVAQPLPGESAVDQAREALRILDRVDSLPHGPLHAFHLRRAAYLDRCGNAEGAKLERASADGLAPMGAFDSFLSGLEQYKRNQFTQAKRYFDDALRIQPNHFWAQCLSAVCDLNSKPPRSAVASARLSACLQSHPNLAWLYLLRGFAYGQMGAAATTRADAEANFRDAEADYNEVIRRDPDGTLRYALLANRGLVRFQNRRFDEAVADLSEAIELNPRQYNAYVTLAQVYRQRHEFDKAVEKLGQAIALKPEMAALYRTRALWNLERTTLSPPVRAAALEDLEQAIRLESPGSVELGKDHAKRGQVLIQCGRFEEALDACETALRSDPKNTEAHRWRVAAMLELKRYDDVIASCDGYLRAGPPSADLLELRGLAKARRNDFASAIEDYTQALILQPEVAVLHARRGWAYLVSGSPQLARRDFLEALRLDPSSGDAYSGLGSALVLIGEHREAVIQAEESLRHGETTPRTLYNATRIYAQAATYLATQVGRRGRAALDPVVRYQERALELLGQAMEQTPAEQKVAFWSEVVLTDHALAEIRRLPAYARLAAKYESTTR